MALRTVSIKNFGPFHKIPIMNWNLGLSFELFFPIHKYFDLLIIIIN